MRMTVLVAFLMAYGAFAQPPTRPRVSFNRDLTSVGPNFRGDDIVAITARAKRSASAAILQRSEFETTAQFEARKASLSGSSRARSDLAFIIPNDPNHPE